MVSEILQLTVFIAFLIVVVMLFALRGESSSIPAQRRHDEEYAPVGNVYVVLQTTNNYTTYNEHEHYHDNRSITVQGPQGMPLIADRQREIQQQEGRVFRVVGEREEWQPEYNGWLPPGHSGMKD